MFPANVYHRPDNGLVRTGKVAVIRDVAAVTYVKLATDESSCLAYLSQLRGNDIFLIHWQDNVCPVEFGSSSQSPRGGESWRLELGETTITIGQVHLSARRQGDPF